MSKKVIIATIAAIAALCVYAQVIAMDDSNEQGMQKVSKSLAQL